MADNKVVLKYEGKEFEYPIVESTIGDRGINIAKLRDDTGLITLDIGYKNTGATISEITYLDGDNGELLYRGYPIDQLAEKSNFTEVMYLLLHGELPTKEQFENFDKNIKKYNWVSEEMKKTVGCIPKICSPNGSFILINLCFDGLQPSSGKCTVQRRLGSRI